MNPSGRSVDTFLYDLTATPLWNNTVPSIYDNMGEYDVALNMFGMESTEKVAFINYVEGIYVGYKFYETAATEGLIDYDKTVQYPFGHGLSYTSFQQEITSFSNDGTNINMTVRVSNTGSVAGKDVVEGFYAAGAFETPYADTAKGKVKDWVEAYKKMFGTDANTQSVIGYNAVMTFAHYAKLAGKDLTGQKMLDALESGDPYLDIFSSPPSKFSKTNHLANTITQVQQVKNGRWVVIKEGLSF